MNNHWERTLKRRIDKGDKLHFTLLDPGDRTPHESAIKAKGAVMGGTDGIMVGGSTIQSRGLVFKTVKEIRAVVGTHMPIILFPNCAEAICKGADYVFFMMLLNSKKIDFLIGEQLKGAPLVKKFGIEPVSVGYIVISTSDKPTTVERIGNVDRIREKDIDKAINYALTAQYYGMKYIYLEAGSGAQRPVPNKMISAIRRQIDVPMIVGGGIRSAKTASDKVKAGADVIVTGNIIADRIDKMAEIIAAVQGHDHIIQ